MDFTVQEMLSGGDTKHILEAYVILLLEQNILRAWSDRARSEKER